jgi:hypothetical protein
MMCFSVNRLRRVEVDVLSGLTEAVVVEKRLEVWGQAAALRSGH